MHRRTLGRKKASIIYIAWHAWPRGLVHFGRHKKHFVSLHHKGCFVAKFITNITNHLLWTSPVPRAHPQEWRRSQATPERGREATVAVKCLGNRRQFTTKSSQNLTRIVYSTVGQSLMDHAQKSTAPSLNKPRCSFFDVNVTSMLEERINQPRSLVEGALSAHLDAYLRECGQQKPVSDGCKWMKMSIQQGWNCKKMPERTCARYFVMKHGLEMVNYTHQYTLITSNIWNPIS